MSTYSKALGMLFVSTIIAYTSTYITLNLAYKNDSKVILFIIPFIFCGVIRFFLLKVAYNNTFIIPISYVIILLYFLLLSINSKKILFNPKGWYYAGMAITSAIFIGCWVLIMTGSVIFTKYIKR